MLWTMGGPLIHKISGRSHGKVFQKDSKKVPSFHWLTGSPVVFAASVIFEKEVHFKTISASKNCGSKAMKNVHRRQNDFQGLVVSMASLEKTKPFHFRFCKVFTGSGKWKSGSPNIPNWQYIPLIYHLSRWCPSLLFLDYCLHLFLIGWFTSCTILTSFRVLWHQNGFLGGDGERNPQIQRPKIKNLPLSPWEKEQKERSSLQNLYKNDKHLVRVHIIFPANPSSQKFLNIFALCFLENRSHFANLRSFSLSSCSTKPPHCGGS